MGEVNRLQGTIRGGQFHVGHIAGRWAIHLRIRGRWISSWPVGSGYQPPYQPRFAAAGTVLEASPKGHYTQLVVQPLGWTTKR